MSVLTLENVSKRFGPITVVKDVTVALEPGQVHVLLGENGAGKSTLIKMMAGIYTPDAGRIVIDGQGVTLPTPKVAESYGIATIHQELNLVGSLTIAENVLLGRLPNRGGWVDRAEMRRQARAALGRIGLSIDVDRKVGELGIAQRQLIEIARALSMNSRVLILDEPTAALTGVETEQLFAVMHELKAKGVAMVFISHHLDELAKVGDVVTVLRDGEFVAHVPATTTEPELVRLMVGRAIDEQYPKVAAPVGEPLLEVVGLSGARFRDVTFSVRAGEIVGIAGLVGSGRTELVRAIAGADPSTGGEIRVRSVKLGRRGVIEAMAHGLGHVPEDRKGQGLVLGASVADNAGLATLFSTARGLLADRAGQRQRAREITEALSVKMASLDQPIRYLSGGNQQKVVFGRWLLAGSSILLLDEPTRGVDVGAKVEIYQLMNDIVSRGGAVVMVSSELPEVLGMSDRVLVMSGGRLAGELARADATQDAVMTLAVKNHEQEGAAR